MLPSDPFPQRYPRILFPDATLGSFFSDATLGSFFPMLPSDPFPQCYPRILFSDATLGSFFPDATLGSFFPMLPSDPLRHALLKKKIRAPTNAGFVAKLYSRNDAAAPRGCFIEALDIDFARLRLPLLPEDELTPQQLLAVRTHACTPRTHAGTHGRR